MVSWDQKPRNHWFETSGVAPCWAVEKNPSQIYLNLHVFFRSSQPVKENIAPSPGQNEPTELSGPTCGKIISFVFDLFCCLLVPRRALRSGFNGPGRSLRYPDRLTQTFLNLLSGATKLVINYQGFPLSISACSHKRGGACSV